MEIKTVEIVREVVMVTMSQGTLIVLALSCVAAGIVIGAILCIRLRD